MALECSGISGRLIWPARCIAGSPCPAERIFAQAVPSSKRSGLRLSASSSGPAKMTRRVSRNLLCLRPRRRQGIAPLEVLRISSFQRACRLIAFSPSSFLRWQPTQRRAPGAASSGCSGMGRLQVKQHWGPRIRGATVFNDLRRLTPTRRLIGSSAGWDGQDMGWSRTRYPIIPDG